MRQVPRDGKLLLDEKYFICDIVTASAVTEASPFVTLLSKKGDFFMKKTQKLLYIALLIAIEVILTRFLSIQTPIVRIGFGMLPVALVGILFGPISAGVAGALGDLIGMFLFPGGAYFPGFTVSAFLTGTILGLFLHNRFSLKNVILAVTTISIVVHLGLNTVWLSMILNKGVLALLPARILKTGITLLTDSFVIFSVWTLLKSRIPLVSQK